MEAPGGTTERPRTELERLGIPPESEPVVAAPENNQAEAREEVIEALDRADGHERPVTTPRETQPVAPQVAPAVDPAQSIEPEVQRILSEGLYETYTQLPPELQAKFKSEGERTASAIAQLLLEVKVRVGKILLLIRRWLSIIPGINRYYLEQEAKLKTDAVLGLNRKPRA